MTERQKQIIRLALSYIGANLSEVNEFFAPTEENEDPLKMSYNGEEMDWITEEELEEIHKLLQ